MRLADRVAAGGELHGFLVVHAHAREGLAHLRGRRQRIGLAVHAFGIDVYETHLHGGKRVFQRFRLCHVAVTTVARRQPFLFITPIGVLFRSPYVFTAEGEAEGLQARNVIGNGAGERDQVRPGNLVAVFLLDWPQQAAALVGVDVIRPGIQRCKTLVAGVGAAAAVGHAVGTRRMPGNAGHHTHIAAPVSRPPVLAVGHQGPKIGLEGLDIKRLQRFAIVEGGA